MALIAGEPFLRNPSTIAAIEEIARAERLVLYCGAGATRDQTGLGWDAMVLAVFDAARRDRIAERRRDEIVHHLVASPGLSAQQKASLVLQIVKPAHLTETKFLDRYLRRILYKERGWGHGLLLRNIATLADFYAKSQRDIIIVTTNYDDYLIRRITRLIDETTSDAGGDDVGGRPGIEVSLLGDALPIIQRLPEGSASTIKVTHVHGLVVSDELAKQYPGIRGKTGDLVFSEQSYVATEGRTSAYLDSLLDDRTSLVTVGASLSDPPLVRAIVEGAKRNASIFALIDLPNSLSPDSKDDLISSDTQEVLSQRAIHLGVQAPLLPSGYHQVAQFIDEIRVCAAVDELGQSVADDTYADVGCYSQRLERWWQNWSTSGRAVDHQGHYEYLAVTLEEIVDLLAQWGCPAVAGEVLRLEMWLRVDPSVSRNHRVLTLYANSSGLLLAASGRREEPIKRVSSISSVRAFTAGKPSIATLPELGYVEDASRWKTFLSVPIFHEVDVPIPRAVGEDGLSVSGSVPVAVVTLSSTLGGSRSTDNACFTDKRLGNEEYNELLDLMISVGRVIATQ